MMTTVTCNRCGHRFTTEAVTATRCRRCRHSVRIEAGSSSSSSSSAEGDGAVPAIWLPTGWALVGADVAGAGCWALWHGLTMTGAADADPEAVRRSRRRWFVVGGVQVVAGVVVVVRYGGASGSKMR